MDDQQIPLDVVGVRVELPSKQPVLVLRGAAEGTEKQHVAIMVGAAEANAVAAAMEGRTPPRPLTHDLLVDALNGLGGGVETIEIGLLDSQTYSGTITLTGGHILDARASDAIAVAVRVNCPVTMDENTLAAVAVTPRFRTVSADGEQAASSDPADRPAQSKGPISEAEIEEFQNFLDSAGPDDFRS